MDITNDSILEFCKHGGHDRCEAHKKLINVAKSNGSDLFSFVGVCGHEGKVQGL